MGFSKPKAHLHRAAERTRDGLWDRIGCLIDQVSSNECANFFIAAGYEPECKENALTPRLD